MRQTFQQSLLGAGIVRHLQYLGPSSSFSMAHSEHVPSYGQHSFYEVIQELKRLEDAGIVRRGEHGNHELTAV